MSQLDVGALYRTYGHSVLRRARQILGSEEEAHDVLQEIFLGLVAHPAQFAGRSSPSTFLYTVTTRACLARLRNHRNRARLLDEEVRPWSSDVDPSSAATPTLLRAALAQLPEAEARAVIHYHLDGMSHSEIAEILGCSRRQVGNLLVRAQRSPIQEAS